MDILTPPPPYAEDLSPTLSASILTFHVLNRAYVSGALAGTLIGSLAHLRALRAHRLASPLPTSSQSPSSAPSSSGAKPSGAVGVNAAQGTGVGVGVSGRPDLLYSVLQRVARAGVISTGLLAVALVVRMRGRGEVEWQDRAYRLLHNPGQNEVDRFIFGGIGAGVVAGLVASPGKGVGRSGEKDVSLRGVKGGLQRARLLGGWIGVGALVGTVGYMVWRYGVKGGKFEQVVQDVVPVREIEEAVEKRIR